MAMTAQVKGELASTTVTKTCCRKAEVSSMLRFADALHLVNGGIVVEAELDTGSAARRTTPAPRAEPPPLSSGGMVVGAGLDPASAARRRRRDIAEVFGHHPEVVLLKGSGIRR